MRPMARPKIVVFASGTKDGGGSGFENLVKSPDLDADIVAVVSNHEHGGVRERAERLGVPFIYFPGPFDARHYSSVLPVPERGQKTAIEWVALSGWFKFVRGLDPAKTFNIHPSLLSQFNGRFGGKAMFGSRLHEEVLAAFERGEITESGCTMHFVTDEYDRGPAFFEFRIPLTKDMTPGSLAKAINIEEHRWQPRITNMVVHGEISWDGKDPASLVVPADYSYFPKS